jgi:restriction endonuclease Mrr
MAVPDYQTFMLPVLRYAGANAKRYIPKAELIEAMAREFRLSEEEQREMLPSGTSTTFGSRVSWACTYMKKAGLMEAPERAHIQITSQGIKALGMKPAAINIAFLKQYPAFQAFYTRSKKALKMFQLICPQTRHLKKALRLVIKVCGPSWLLICNNRSANARQHSLSDSSSSCS